MEKLQGQNVHRNQNRFVLNVNEFLLAVLEYCWVILVVLNGNSVYHANAERSYHLLPLSVAMTVVLLATNILFGRIRIKRRNLIVALFLCLYTLIYLLFRQHSMSTGDFLYLFLIGLPCLVLLFAELHRKGRLLRLFYRIDDVVCILAIISLFF